MSAQDGGPAFPTEGLTSGEGKAGPTRYTVPGVSLRDYFAGQALAGQVACIRNAYWVDPEVTRRKLIASEAYQLADAMLAERAKP